MNWLLDTGGIIVLTGIAGSILLRVALMRTRRVKHAAEKLIVASFASLFIWGAFAAPYILVASKGYGVVPVRVSDVLASKGEFPLRYEVASVRVDTVGHIEGSSWTFLGFGRGDVTGSIGPSYQLAVTLPNGDLRTLVFPVQKVYPRFSEGPPRAELLFRNAELYRNEPGDQPYTLCYKRPSNLVDCSDHDEKVQLYAKMSARELLDRHFTGVRLFISKADYVRTVAPILG